MFIKLKLIFSALVFFISVSEVSAQVSLKEMSLKEQIDNSSLVVEGRVIAKRAFWDANRKSIYTANTVEVYKVFKGKSISSVEVVTLGGVVGLKALIVHPSLKLQTGDVGIFALIDSDYSSANAIVKSSKVQFKPYGSLQGFYKYNLDEDVAVNPFNKKQGVTSLFYKEIMSITNSNYIRVSNIDIKSEKSQSTKSSSGAAIAISGFSPTTISAGTKSPLTIIGSDFGTQGKVSFKNSDEGENGSFFDALDSQVISWSPTQIIVEVPSLGDIGTAGTGKIRVTDADNNSIESSDELTVSFAEINMPFNPGTGTKAYPIQHVSTNNNGGYTWQMFTDFDANPDAKASVLRAFESWRCETGINWVIGSTTTTDVLADDDVNVIRFDNGSELATNVLATCYSWYKGCDGAAVEWYVDGLDIVFDDDTDWYFEEGLPDFGLYDFESVALHELGHGHQLAHVINTNEVMHYAISFSEDQRVLSAEDIAGANGVQSRSTSSGVCGLSKMTDYSGSCGLSVEENSLENSISLYPNPAKQEFFISSTVVKLDKVEIYDVSGRLVLNIDVSELARTKTISSNIASKGIYFVNIYSDNNFITKKLIIE